MKTEYSIRDHLNELSIIEQEIEDYFHRLNNITEADEKFKQRIKELSFSFVDSIADKIKDIKAEGISYKKSYISLDGVSRDIELIRETYRYIQFRNLKIITKSNKLFDSAKEYDVWKKDSKRLFSKNVSWFFTLPSTKQTAIAAGNSILDFYKGDVFEEIKECVHKFEEISTENLQSAFDNDPKSFLRVINQKDGPTFYLERDPEMPDFKEFISLRKRISQANSKLKKAVDRQKELEKDLKATINWLVEKEADKIYESADIDDIKAEYPRARTDILKEYGYDTIGKFMDPELRRSNRIYDLGSSTLYNLELICKEIREKIPNIVKIRIDTKKRNKKHAELLGYLRSYIKAQENSRHIKELYKNCYSKYEKILKETDYYEEAIDWLYSSLKGKRQISEDFETLKDVYNSRFTREAKKLYDEQSKLLSDSEDLESEWEYFEKNAAECYSYLEKLDPIHFGGEGTSYGLPESLAESINKQKLHLEGLKTALRRYQEWGTKYILHQKKVLLGDEMGLGKTVQAIATMVSLKNEKEKHFFVVCPASVIINWCREVEKHSTLQYVKIHGPERKERFEEWIKSGGVGITTYESLNSLELPDRFRYGLLVVDEAHYVKNPEARRTKSVIEFSEKAKMVLYMTGTALENRVNEMVELVGQLNLPVAKELNEYKFMAASETFKIKAAPVYYRRKREDVLTELPELIEAESWCSLNDKEKEIYENCVLSKDYSGSRRLSWNVKDLKDSSKAKRLKEIADEVKEDGRRIVVFSYFLDTISKICASFDGVVMPPITGKLTPQKRQEVIDQFNDSPAGSILVCQIQAGGTGLNIQAGSVVVITEPQFKPSIENQAISRAYRMGQTRSVLVYRLLCENTI